MLTPTNHELYTHLKVMEEIYTDNLVNKYVLILFSNWYKIILQWKLKLNTFLAGTTIWRDILIDDISRNWLIADNFIR